jgi:NAD-dependent SIR2 family protein deacetylase
MEQNLAEMTAMKWISEADGILITAGAGMGIDSGLPDFRGATGFWRAYPALGAEGVTFRDIANGMAFRVDPKRAWGFYGHRLKLYRNTSPHAGFDILRRWAQSKPRGAFIFTSNVDGQFQKAGFNERQIMECHGSIHHLQCAAACTSDIWSAEGFAPDIDDRRCLLRSALPTCPRCGEVARPNILMFNDWAWLEERTERQEAQLKAWVANVRRLVVVELGAGSSIPTVRNMSERHGPRIIRINPDESSIDKRKGIALAGGALGVLQLLSAQLLGG